MKKDIPKIKFQPITKEDFGFEIVPINTIAKKQTEDHDSQLPHQLKFYNIIFFTQGQGRHYIDFKWYPVKERTLVYLAKEQVHAFDFSTDLDGYCLLFTETFFMSCFSAFPNNYLLHLFNPQFTSPILDIPNESEFIDYFHLLYKEFQTNGDFNHQNITKSLLTILLSKVENIKEVQNKITVDSSKVAMYKEFNLLIENNYQKSRNANFYAGQLAITYKHLNILCKEVAQKTAKNVIDEFVVLQAKRRLINTSIKNSELAYELGFEDPTNFTKYFKNKTGLTPKLFIISIKNI